MHTPLPNILLIMTDQHRGDCLGYAGHPVLQTPFLDDLAGGGTYFPHAYSACPQCIPARRTLLTGRTAANHGVFCNYHKGVPLPGPTLPQLLSEAGYHTHLCGKIHTYPERALYGFMSADWSDYATRCANDDYTAFLETEGCNRDRIRYFGVADLNTWVARPWTLPEHLHPTNWTTECALRFLRRRDPTKPFFLNLSYYFPHQPCIPPQVYWDRYISKELPRPIEADWSRKQEGYKPGLSVSSWRTVLSDDLMHQFRAGYFGLISHIDEQVGRVLAQLPRENTLIIFCSDHGEMLGDHQWVRKTRGLEGSARIPFILRPPASMGLASGVTRHEPIELMDIMPTCLDAAGIPIPPSVDGRSLLDLLRGQGRWREFVHGEQSNLGGEPSSMQYLTDGRWKYIWEPGNGRELFFHLAEDPQERTNLAHHADHLGLLQTWRGRLAEILRHRPEGFVRDGRLVPPERPVRQVDAAYEDA